MNGSQTLLALIEERHAKVGIIGAGYVGQSVAYGTQKAGFQTLCFDIDSPKVDAINHQAIKNLSATKDFEDLTDCQIICICVPTPITKNRKPDLSILARVLTKLQNRLVVGQLIIIESSVAPGTTRNLALPILSRSNLKIGIDFFLAHSPERIDPGNFDYTLKNTPKIISGLEKNSKKLAIAFYSTFVEKIVPVSTVEVAEMTKVLENTFRLVNISLINEMAAFTKASGINIWEVIEAAETKPYGFLAHYPGPGAGGDCIPVLPYHFIDAAKKQNVKLRVIEASGKVNELQPKKVAQKAIELMTGKTKNGSPKVLLIGVSYKPETSDTRNSPAIKIWHHLAKSGVSVVYHDPYVKNINGSQSQKLTFETIESCDLVIITTYHKKIAYRKLLKNGTSVLDTRNIFRGSDHPNIVRF